MKSAHEIKQNKRRETLLENKDKALISKQLVTLDHKSPINRELNEFELKKREDQNDKDASSKTDIGWGYQISCR